MSRIQPVEADGIFAPKSDTHSTWGASIVKDHKTGRYHIFAAHWKGKLSKWASDSRIIRGESDSPFGPWEYKEQLDVLLEGEDFPQMVHNPDVEYREHDGRYYLYYSRGSLMDKEFGGAVFMASADSPVGPWIPHPKNPVLRVENLVKEKPAKPRKKKGPTTTTNPSVVFKGETTYLVYRTGASNRLAKAASPEGPFTDVGGVAKGEDPSVWIEHDVTYVAAHHSFASSTDNKKFTAAKGDPFEDPTYAAGVKPPHEGVSRQERPNIFVEDGVAIAISTAINPSKGPTFNVTRRLAPWPPPAESKP